MNIEKIREALEAAASLTELNPNNYGSDDVWDSIQQVRELLPLADEALAELDKVQQDAEPVAWMRIHEGKTTVRKSKVYINDIPLYTHQPQAQQPGKVLTDEEISEMARLHVQAYMTAYSSHDRVYAIVAVREMLEKVRARITAAINAKAAKQ